MCRFERKRCVAMATCAGVSGGGEGFGDGVSESGAVRSSDVTLQPPSARSSRVGTSTPNTKRKQLMWQTAVRHVIDQRDLNPLGNHRILVTDAYINDINRWGPRTGLGGGGGPTHRPALAARGRGECGVV